MIKDRPIDNMNDPEFTIDYQKEAEETFNKYFNNENNEVIFLNGKWGSGKTSFLNVVLKNEEGKNKKGVKLKIIDLWRVTGDHKPTDMIFKKVYPVSFWSVKYISIIFFALLSTISFYFLNTDNSEWSYPFLLAGFLAGLNQIIGKVNYNDLFLTCLKFRSKIDLFLKKRVIIIDDFDRIESNKQKELYKIFNLLNDRKKIQFVFLGDYTKIINNENDYLQKIIDRRIELPYPISPSYVWFNFMNQLITKIDEKRSVAIQEQEKNNLKKLQTVLISENRVLREVKMFEKYIDEVLIETGSYDRVNLDQQLVIIYLYLFHWTGYT